MSLLFVKLEKLNFGSFDSVLFALYIIFSELELLFLLSLLVNEIEFNILLNLSFKSFFLEFCS
jgi:hypothetical protein